MKTKDGKKLIPYCKKCKRVKPFDEWTSMSATEQAELVRQDHIKFIGSVCPNCVRG